MKTIGKYAIVFLMADIQEISEEEKNDLLKKISGDIYTFIEENKIPDEYRKVVLDAYIKGMQHGILFQITRTI